ncbi:MAG: LytTr DNA-binding domain [Ferruginibacter sp.]|uniref:LytTR family transcriptional regulator DNA-binding domain-containing protein n=1 Tax=Ferruginibacter sp. TaxID=1940288 RepID=UPI00265B09B3|nr:LytTR family transcriptional regulator DNA-binding domain-containing protein [Ferruginibacter sp.]MDB5278471.1 LytTr DNA-binding domain [Ferruginibacter sp.]
MQTISLNKTAIGLQHLAKNVSALFSAGLPVIRFEEKKEKYFWARPEQICFVVSADHYVKALISYGKQKKWMSRHCTIKDLLGILPGGDFIRLNKFYLLNRSHFAGINEADKILFIDDNFPVPVPHCISKYMLDAVKK